MCSLDLFFSFLCSVVPFLFSSTLSIIYSASSPVYSVLFSSIKIEPHHTCCLVLRAALVALHPLSDLLFPILFTPLLCSPLMSSCLIHFLSLCTPSCCLSKTSDGVRISCYRVNSSFPLHSKICALALLILYNPIGIQ